MVVCQAFFSGVFFRELPHDCAPHAWKNAMGIWMLLAAVLCGSAGPDSVRENSPPRRNTWWLPCREALRFLITTAAGCQVSFSSTARRFLLSTRSRRAISTGSFAMRTGPFRTPRARRARILSSPGPTRETASRRRGVTLVPFVLLGFLDAQVFSLQTTVALGGNGSYRIEFVSVHAPHQVALEMRIHREVALDVGP